MSVTISNVIRVTNPSSELLKWCNNNLKLRNPDYDKKVRMHFWVGKTPQYLWLYEIHGDELVLPFGTLLQISRFINIREAKFDFGPKHSVDYGCSIPLYDYQKKAVDTMYWKQFGILQSPAGSGKTQMGIALITKIGQRALWITHTKDLLQQSRDRARQYMGEAMLGTITEGKVTLGRGITFATVQTLCNLDLPKYKDYWDVIVVDECHRVSGSPTSVSQFYKVLNALAARRKYGLSATVHRSDGLIKSTFALLGEVMYAVPREEVADKIMSVGIAPIPTGVPVSRECLNTDGTVQYAKLLKYISEHQGRNQLITECIVENRNRPSLILSDRLAHLETLMKMLPEDIREDAVMISGKMTTKKGKAERERAIADMKTGDKLYLFATYSLCKEGLDIPRLERLYMCTPQKDYAVITQSIGRVARTSKNKEDPVVYDFVDDIQHLVKAYKKRCTTYRKNGAYFVER